MIATFFSLAFAATALTEAPAEITTSANWDVILIKNDDRQPGPARRYEVRWRDANGRWAVANLGKIGTEDWEEDFLFLGPNNVFCALGTQVGYQIPVLIDQKSKWPMFMDGASFSLRASWQQADGLASFKGYLLFLCRVDDRRYLVLAKGRNVRKLSIEPNLEWVGTDGTRLLYRKRMPQRPFTRHYSSTRLPKIVHGSVRLFEKSADLHDPDGAIVQLAAPRASDSD